MLLFVQCALFCVLTLTGDSGVHTAPTSPRITLDTILEHVKTNTQESSDAQFGRGIGDGKNTNDRQRRQTVSDSEDVSFSDAMGFLSDFNYLPQMSSSEDAASSMSAEGMASALRAMQEMAGIEQTGVLDDETKRMMLSPRCGVPDRNEPVTSGTSRQKRYVIRQTKWSDDELSYKIKNYTPDLDSPTVDLIIQQAFQMWGDESPLTFTKKTSGDVNIELEFVTGDHGDGLPFDGPRTSKGVRLAHAFYPLRGDVHFDDDEVLTNDQHDVNLLQLAVHELGHSLGLMHSNDKNAVMTPYYYYRQNFQLHRDDIAGIQDLYGVPTTTASPPTTTTPSVVVTPNSPTCPPRTRRPAVRPSTCANRARRLPSAPRRTCTTYRSRQRSRITSNCLRRTPVVQNSL